MKKLTSLILIASLTVAADANAQRQHQPYQQVFTPESYDYLVPYLGAYDVTQNDDEATQFGLEYRFAPYYYTLRPMVGVNFTTDGSLYGYGGVVWDIDLLGNHTLYLSPNFAAGFYHKNSGKNLGGPIEFRSGVELSYVFPNYHKVGVAFNHISNASIYDRNPGAETLLINYHVPFDKLVP